MKMSGISREGFLAFFYSFLLEQEYHFNIGDSYELMELFLESFEFEND